MELQNQEEQNFVLFCSVNTMGLLVVVSLGVAVLAQVSSP